MRIVFVANVDWFFESHFLHLARRARARGIDVALAARMELARDRLAASGLDLIDLPTRRGGLAPTGLREAVARVAGALEDAPGSILHGFGLFGITVGGWAGRGRRPNPSVYTITGRGYAAAASGARARIARAGARAVCKRLADGPDVRWVAENHADLVACGLSSAERAGRTRLVGGAGIDPGLFSISQMPAAPPLKVALVSRMIWSKGIDTAVAAVALARARGVDVELSLAGGVDAGNPRAYTAEQLQAFARVPGVRWLGRVADIDALWASHHVAVLPSRGGEGLPKSLIEAAACGRPVLTSDVPGCAEFAAQTGGWTVPADQPERLAAAMGQIAACADLPARGAKAHAVVLAGYTQDHNWRIIERLYDELTGA